MPQLWHVSENPGISVFHPRLAPDHSRAVVWAIDDDHLGHYLLPRDCPRVCFRRGAAAAESDVQQFLRGDHHLRVVVIEESWFAQARDQTLWLYAMPTLSFECIDSNAGYYVTEQAVVPSSAGQLVAPLAELCARGYELRVLPSIRAFADQVARSSLAFSVIRLRNAV
jgi:hypothetical protein